MNKKSNSISVDLSMTRAGEILPRFRLALSHLLDQAELSAFSRQLESDLALAFTEGVTNTIRHARELEKRQVVEARLFLKKNTLEMHIDDHGAGFDLDQVPVPRFDQLDESGRGLFMMRQLMDEVVYQKKKSKNTLVLKRHLAGLTAEEQAIDLLLEMGSLILDDTDLSSLHQTFLQSLIHLFKVERASLFMLDSTQQLLTLTAQRGLALKEGEQITIKPGEGITGYVFLHAKPCLIENMTKNQSGWTPRDHYRSRSFISAPVMGSQNDHQGEAIGVINLTDRLEEGPFTKRDLKLLSTIARQFSIGLHLATLVRKAREADRIRDELALASRIQKSYLPLTVPHLAGFDLSGWLKNTESVGGDYYDFIPAAHNGLYVVVADVSGHNVAASLTMANVRAHLQALCAQNLEPGEILTKLNQILFEDLKRGDQFVSMVLARLQSDSSTLHVASAGHRFPLWLREQNWVTTPMVEHTVLGALHDEAYSTLSLNLHHNDRLVFYTDGIPEAKIQTTERWSDRGFQQFLLKNHSLSASQLTTVLALHLEEIAVNSQLDDDATLVVVDVKKAQNL